MYLYTQERIIPLCYQRTIFPKLCRICSNRKNATDCYSKQYEFKSLICCTCKNYRLGIGSY